MSCLQEQLDRVSRNHTRLNTSLLTHQIAFVKYLPELYSCKVIDKYRLYDLLETV